MTLSGIEYANSQADPGDPGQDPDLIPLDPGSWILVAAGVGYGLKKWKDAKHNSVSFNPDDNNSHKEVD